MKLAKLIPHTSEWTGVPEAQVRTVVRALRPAGLISSAGQNPNGADMSADDKINLLLGVCGVEIANRAAEYVRVWRQVIRIDSEVKGDPFAFTQARNVTDFFVALVTKDLSGGALDEWLKEKNTNRGQVTLDFYVDECVLTLVVSRLVKFSDPKAPHVQKTATESLEVRFIPPAPGGEHDFIFGNRKQSFKAASKLIRRLDAANIRGWGTCLTDAT